MDATLNFLTLLICRTWPREIVVYDVHRVSIIALYASAYSAHPSVMNGEAENPEYV